MVKNLPTNAGDTKDENLFPCLGRASGEGNGSPFSILAWEIPWTEEAGGLQSMGSQRVGHYLATKRQPLSAQFRSPSENQSSPSLPVCLLSHSVMPYSL